MSGQLSGEVRHRSRQTSTFGSRLVAAIDRRGPLCVGIDPHRQLLADWGLPDDASGLERFALTVVEALGDQVAVLKPQSAFFERHGSAGIAVLERVIGATWAAGALVILDAKRGDIGSTMQAYADAYLVPSSPLCVDAVTASPYLGFDSLRPLLDAAQRFGAGVFVLARTSNPEGGLVQNAVTADGRTVVEDVFARIAAANAEAVPLGSVGAVVGATAGAVDKDLTRLNGPILVPGLGAQGGTADDLKRLFGSVRRGVLPAVSRSVLSAGPTLHGMRAAAVRLAAECAAALR